LELVIKKQNRKQKDFLCQPKKIGIEASLLTSDSCFFVWVFHRALQNRILIIADSIFYGGKLNSDDNLLKTFHQNYYYIYNMKPLNLPLDLLCAMSKFKPSTNGIESQMC